MRYAKRLAAVLAISIGVLASSGLAEQPTTQPASVTARILVLPFITMNGSEEAGGLGRSIQQSLVADLTPSAPGRLASADLEGNDTQSAVAAGRKLSADFVVIGSFTIIESTGGKQLRIVGQIVDVPHEAALSGFKVTGMYGDIFELEDQAGKQIRRRLSDAGAIRVPVLALGPSASAQPVQIVEEPMINEYQQAYGNPQPMVGGATNAGYDYYYGNPYNSGGINLTYGFGLPLFFYGGGYDRGFRGQDHGGFREGASGHSHGSSHAGSHGASGGHR